MKIPIHMLKELYKKPGLYKRKLHYGKRGWEWWWLEIGDDDKHYWRHSIDGGKYWCDAPWPAEDLTKSSPLEYLLLARRVFKGVDCQNRPGLRRLD